MLQVVPVVPADPADVVAMHDALAMLLGLLAWSVIFVPLFILWWLPGHREKQALKAAARRREERLRRRFPGRAA